MEKEIKQLGFGLAIPEKELYSLDRFFEGDFNKAPLKAVQSFGTEGSPFSMVITGSKGSGKSHLLKGMSIKNGDSALFAGAPSIARLPDMAGSVKRLASFQMVCIDDIDIPGEQNLPFYDELFHLFNNLKSSGGFFAVSMKTSPALCDFLPDYLSTRLLSGMVVNIKKPGDDEKAGIIKKMAHDRNIDLGAEEIEYILKRSPRSIGELAAVLDGIGKALSPASRGISLQLIRRVIESGWR